MGKDGDDCMPNIREARHNPLQALKDFYRSKTCEKFHNRATGMYLYSDLYLVDDYLMEIGKYE